MEIYLAMSEHENLRKKKREFNKGFIDSIKEMMLIVDDYFITNYFPLSYGITKISTLMRV